MTKEDKHYTVQIIDYFCYFKNATKQPPLYATAMYVYGLKSFNALLIIRDLSYLLTYKETIRRLESSICL